MNVLEFIKFPMEERDWLTRIIIGSIIMVIPVLNIMVLGYYIECIYKGMKGSAALPGWEDWANYLREGLAALLIIVVYCLIPLTFTVLLNAMPVIGVLLSTLIALITGAVVPMALANFALTQNPRDAFMAWEILFRIKNMFNSYILYYLAMVLYVAIITGITFSIPLISFIGVMLLFYGGIIFFNLIGRLYSGATGA